MKLRMLVQVAALRASPVLRPIKGRTAMRRPRSSDTQIMESILVVVCSRDLPHPAQVSARERERERPWQNSRPQNQNAIRTASHLALPCCRVRAASHKDEGTGGQPTTSAATSKSGLALWTSNKLPTRAWVDAPGIVDPSHSRGVREAFQKSSLPKLVRPPIDPQSSHETR